MFYAYLALFKTNSPFSLTCVDDRSVNVHVYVCMQLSLISKTNSVDSFINKYSCTAISYISPVLDDLHLSV